MPSSSLCQLLSPGNSKTGAPVSSFSLPEIKTCPGATELCKKACYAKRFRRFPQVQEKYLHCLAQSEKGDFVDQMVRAIREAGALVVRVHVSGDFYSAKYVRKWILIAERCPEVAFFAYTRSWRVEKMRRSLEDLRRQKNFQLWWSADAETGQPPEGMTAYMANSDYDIPEYDVSLVFRTKRKTIKRTHAGAVVCPMESGDVEAKKSMSCFQCRKCFSNAIIS